MWGVRLQEQTFIFVGGAQAPARMFNATLARLNHADAPIKQTLLVICSLG